MVKGCLMAFFVLVLVVVVSAFVKSTKEAVYLLDWYKIDNFNIVKLK